MKKDSTAPNWRMTTLEEIAAPIPNAIVDGPFGSNLKISDYVEDGVPVLQGKNITNDTFRWFDVRFISTHKASELKRSSVRIGDILLVKIGSIGYSAVVRDLRGFDFAIIPANLAKITPNTAIIDTEYLHKWLTSVETKRYLEGVASKTAQPALSLGKIKALPVPLPPLPEQRRIAEVLDRAEALRAKRRAALAQLDTLTQSIFLDLFGDPIRRPKEKLSTVRDLIVKGIVLEIQDGNHGERHPKVEDFVPDGIPFIAANCLNDGRLNLTTCDFLPPRWLKELRIGFAKADDVLLSHKGTIGLTAIVPNRNEVVILSPQVTYYRTDVDKLNPIFLRGYFQTDSFQSMLNKNAQQTTRAYVGITRQLDLPICMPPLELQLEFARRVAAIEKLKDSHRASVAELDALFAVLQHRAFRGEL